LGRRQGTGTRTPWMQWEVFTTRGRNTSLPSSGAPRAPTPGCRERLYNLGHCIGTVEGVVALDHAATARLTLMVSLSPAIGPGRLCLPCPPHFSPLFLELNSVSGLVSKLWYRILFDQSEMSMSRNSPTDSPKVRPGRDPRVNRSSISRISRRLGAPTLSLNGIL